MSRSSRLWPGIKLGLAFGIPVVLFAVTIVYETRSLSAHGTLTDAHIVGLISVAMSLVPLGLMVLALIALVYVQNKGVGGLLLGSCLTFTAVAYASTEWRESMRIDAFTAFAARSTALVEAIKGYEQARGRAPLDLARLTPEYLAKLPSTEMGTFKEILYHHEVVTPEQTTWGLEVVISQSPPARLIYRPSDNYSDLEGAQDNVGDWIFEYQEFNRHPVEESEDL
jgi:hypothetical protein